MIRAFADKSGRRGEPCRFHPLYGELPLSSDTLLIQPLLAMFHLRAGKLQMD